MKLFSFKGRLNRQGYFGRLILSSLLFGLLNYILGEVMIDTGYTSIAFGQLAVIIIAVIYSLSLMTRRFHDINRSGWWSIAGLIPLLNVIAGLVLLFKKGTVGDNKYGEDSLAR